ncbi:hypothetical protein [Rhizobium miluonense]|uniref:hypothetical protein n=1 Tax=Rhizobium miluonense TaxID=411945 RepID=UPI001112A82F|nr:hypothetical protein [Rhizobium miluonense]
MTRSLRAYLPRNLIRGAVFSLRITGEANWQAINPALQAKTKKTNSRSQKYNAAKRARQEKSQEPNRKGALVADPRNRLVNGKLDSATKELKPKRK